MPGFFVTRLFQPVKNRLLNLSGSRTSGTRQAGSAKAAKAVLNESIMAPAHVEIICAVNDQTGQLRAWFKSNRAILTAEARTSTDGIAVFI